MRADLNGYAGRRAPHRSGQQGRPQPARVAAREALRIVDLVAQIEGPNRCVTRERTRTRFYQQRLGSQKGRIVIQAPQRSVLIARISRRDAAAMPPVGSLRVDDAGAAMLSDWIAGLASCD